MLRTHTCGQLALTDVGTTVTLAGWVHARRDHGGIIFVDLRDRYGITQVKFDPDYSSEALMLAESYRSEWVIQVTGVVLKRPAEMVNANMATGEIEIGVTHTKILNSSKTPPFEIGQDAHVHEDLRLQYRYLDLRHQRLQKIITDRDRVITYIRAYMHDRGFVDIQTPILANSSPEGARDYLVPSRLYPGKFFALPQAPQQFKQLLMVAGFDKYFQIAPCFRDEDPRADRHPGDFYQVDMEMSFVEQEDVWRIIEPLMIELTNTFSEKQILTTPFPRITYHEALSKYGSDKPDLRFGFEFIDITAAVRETNFKVFADAIKNNGVIYAMNVQGGASKFSRKDIDELTELAKGRGAKGLAYIVYERELRSPILKFLTPQEIQMITKTVGAQEGDIVFFGADSWQIVTAALGVVRNECGSRMGLKDPKKASLLWVTDFPMYEKSEEGKIDFSHNPFSMPQGGMDALESQDPLTIKAYQYDLVYNGYEVCSGAIRNHDPKIMYAAFALAGYDKEQVDAKFGHMIKAFEYGAPPHGGLALGLDRILMVLFECHSIRDIYAFPKNGQGIDPMLGSPSFVDQAQLQELHLKIIDSEKKKK